MDLGDLPARPLLVFIGIISSCLATAMSMEQKETAMPQPCYARVAPAKIMNIV